MFKQLLWKEWHENLWKLVFCGAVSLAFTALLFRIRLFPDAANGIVISFVQMLVVPVVYALDIFSGEMSNRTIYLLFKFPVPRWKIFFSKYLVCILGIILVFVATALSMAILGHEREVSTGLLVNNSLLFGAVALMLFTWFSAFAAQSRSEAGSLVAVFGVIIGWAIIFFWSLICQVPWANHFTPYSLIVWAFRDGPEWFRVSSLITSNLIALAAAIAIACYRFVKVRRVL